MEYKSPSDKMNAAREIAEEKLCERFQLSKETAMVKVKQYRYIINLGKVLKILP